MPTYDYKCVLCHAVKEVHHSIKADPIMVCEICGSIMKRLISGGAGFLWEGSGFFINDYKKKEEK